jgi:hypothetical protein
MKYLVIDKNNIFIEPCFLVLDIKTSSSSEIHESISEALALYGSKDDYCLDDYISFEYTLEGVNAAKEYLRQQYTVYQAELMAKHAAMPQVMQQLNTALTYSLISIESNGQITNTLAPIKCPELT